MKEEEIQRERRGGYEEGKLRYKRGRGEMKGKGCEKRGEMRRYW